MPFWQVGLNFVRRSLSSWMMDVVNHYRVDLLQERNKSLLCKYIAPANLSVFFLYFFASLSRDALMRS